MSILLNHPSAMEAKIKENIRSFDIRALLAVLKHLGYKNTEITFQSNMSSVSAEGLIDSIKFNRGAIRSVEITVNWGLLTVHTPLPTYFFKLIEESYGDVVSFTDFVNFFDHYLFRNFVDALYPEHAEFKGLNWNKIKKSFLSLMDLKSEATLHWLFDLIYPELDVNVTRSFFSSNVLNDGIRLGHYNIGESYCLGQKQKLKTKSFQIILYSDSFRSPCHKAWMEVAKERFNKAITPILGNMNLYLEIFLVVRGQHSVASLDTGSYLGYDRITGGEFDDKRFPIFSGKVS